MSLTARSAMARPASHAMKDLLGEGGHVEFNRLQDTLKVKEKTIEEQMREITTLKTQLQAAQKALMSKQSQMEGAEERAAQALGGASANNKELSMIKADKKKLEVQVGDLMRSNAKLKEQIARAGEKNPALSHQLASLQSDVRAARLGADATNDELKAVNNQLRAKDKEIARLNKMVEEVHAVHVRNGVLENKVLELTRQLDEAREEIKTLNEVIRGKDAHVSKVTKDWDLSKEMLAVTNAAHADTSAKLKAMTNRCGELDLEVTRLRDENARTGAVAARVAASEVKAGSKDEGTVPLLQHLEELKYWGGEVNRLKDKLAGLEKQLSVADELKNQYRNTAERLSMGGSVGMGGGGGLLCNRTSMGGPDDGTPSRPSSASRQRRPSWGAGPGGPRPATPDTVNRTGASPAVKGMSQGSVLNNVNVDILTIKASSKSPSPDKAIKLASPAAGGDKTAGPDVRVTRSRAAAGGVTAVTTTGAYLRKSSSSVMAGLPSGRNTRRSASRPATGDDQGSAGGAPPVTMEVEERSDTAAVVSGGGRQQPLSSGGAPSPKAASPRAQHPRSPKALSPCPQQDGSSGEGSRSRDAPPTPVSARVNSWALKSATESPLAAAAASATITTTGSPASKRRLSKPVFAGDVHPHRKSQQGASTLDAHGGAFGANQAALDEAADQTPLASA